MVKKKNGFEMDELVFHAQKRCSLNGDTEDSGRIGEIFLFGRRWFIMKQKTIRSVYEKYGIDFNGVL